MQIDAARRAMRMTSSMSCSTSRAAHLSASRSRRRRDGRGVVARASREATRSASPDDVDNTEGDGSSLGTSGRCTRRGALRAALGAGALALAATTSPDLAVAAADPANPRSYFQRYPTLFAPFYGDDERVTLLKTVVPDQVWALEQNLAIGPLETPLRCVVIRLEDGSLWIHAPLAPTAEFFALVESIGGPVRHVVVPTYALEHKIFARDALERWPAADLWVAPGQFSFPVEVSAAEVYGREPRGVLGRAEDGGSGETPPWLSEIDCEVLRAGKFGVAWKDVTIREATFFHARSKTLVVTDAVARVPYEIPPLQTPEKLLLVGKRSTADPQPPDTPRESTGGVEEDGASGQLLLPGARGARAGTTRGGGVDPGVGRELRRARGASAGASGGSVAALLARSTRSARVRGSSHRQMGLRARRPRALGRAHRRGTERISRRVQVPRGPEPGSVPKGGHGERLAAHR